MIRRIILVAALAFSPAIAAADDADSLAAGAGTQFDGTQTFAKASAPEAVTVDMAALSRAGREIASAMENRRAKPEPPPYPLSLSSGKDRDLAGDDVYCWTEEEHGVTYYRPGGEAHSYTKYCAKNRKARIARALGNPALLMSSIFGLPLAMWYGGAAMLAKLAPLIGLDTAGGILVFGGSIATVAIIAGSFDLYLWLRNGGPWQGEARGPAW